VNYHILGEPGMSYVICEKRKGNPKVNVEVCKRKCKSAYQCKPYNDYLGITQALHEEKDHVQDRLIPA
jgi:hypothetical protein